MMTATLVPSIVADGVRRVRQAVGNEMLHPGGRKPREIIAACYFAGDLLELLWDHTRALLSSGLERTQLVTRLEEWLAVADSSLEMFVAAREMIERSPGLPHGFQSDLVKWEEKSRSISTLQDKARSILSWLDAPKNPVDPAAIVTTDDPRTSERYKSADDLFAQSQANSGE